MDHRVRRYKHELIKLNLIFKQNFECVFRGELTQFARLVSHVEPLYSKVSGHTKSLNNRLVMNL